MTRRALLVLALLAALAAPACSSGPAICGALDDGQSSIEAARTAYGDAKGDAATAERMLRQGAADVRSGCPERETNAVELEGLAQAVAP